jgi:lysophospholipase L1-like esterase
MVERVRRRHPATLNLGTAGGGPLIMLAQLREYLPALRPRTVLWCYFSGNDLLDLRRESEHPLLQRYLAGGFTQGLAGRQDALDRAMSDYAQNTLLTALLRRSRRRLELQPVLLLRELRGAAGLALAEPYRLQPTEPEYALFARVLAEARSTVEAWGGRLVFVYLPGWSEPPRQLGEAEYARVKAGVGRRTRALVAGMGLPLVDVEQAFAAQEDPSSLYACRGCHYGPRGYAVAAEAVLSALAAGAP